MQLFPLNELVIFIMEFLSFVPYYSYVCCFLFKLFFGNKIFFLNKDISKFWAQINQHWGDWVILAIHKIWKMFHILCVIYWDKNSLRMCGDPFKNKMMTFWLNFQTLILKSKNFKKNEILVWYTMTVWDKKNNLQ